MDVTHPGSKPLREDQKVLLGEFCNKVESRISSHGQTAADVQRFVDEIKKHPEVSAALLEEIRGEVGKLMKVSASALTSTDQDWVGATDLGFFGLAQIRMILRAGSSIASRRL